MTPLLLAFALAVSPPEPAVEALSGGPFGPAGIVRLPAAPRRVVLYLTADLRSPALRPTLVALARDGALVVALSTERWLRHLRRDRCAYPAGDLEAVAQSLEKALGLPAYLRPILVGEVSGGTVAWSALEQAPAGTFLGAVAVGPRRPLAPLAFCRGSAATNPASLPRGEVPSGDLARLREAVERLDAPAALPAAPTSGPAVADLPLVEVAPTAAGPGAFAVLVTGDGGWAGIDRELAAALAAKGLPVVGLDSLAYFWKRRTPESFAADLGRIIEHHAAALGRPEVALIGYSRGADVLPAAVGLLGASPRARVRAVALLGPGLTAEFELHVADFLGSGGGGRPLLPDVERLAGTPVLCLFGSDEAESLCPRLRGRPGVRLVELAGGHHFAGDYGAVAREVLRTLDGVAQPR
jgi:type IV secretory pathway VirJ component